MSYVHAIGNVIHIGCYNRCFSDSSSLCFRQFILTSVGKPFFKTKLWSCSLFLFPYNNISGWIMVNAAKCFLETYEGSECFLTLSWYLWFFLRWKPGQHLIVWNTDSAAPEFSLTAFFVTIILWKTLLLKAISHCTV